MVQAVCCVGVWWGVFDMGVQSYEHTGDRGEGEVGLDGDAGGRALLWVLLGSHPIIPVVPYLPPNLQGAALPKVGFFSSCSLSDLD